MKKAISTLMIIAIMHAAITVQAQVPSLNTGKLNAGSLLTQLSSAIKPTSFLSSWASGKAGWLGQAGKIASATGLANSVSSLAGFIKPSMFKNGFSLDNLTKAASAAKTMSDATGLLKTLEGGLKPEALTSDWAGKRTGWLSALSALK